MNNPKTLCVAGASGLVGSNIVKAALAKGYRVNGTMRDAEDESKRPYLMALPGAAERLTLFSADTAQSDSFDAALEGADAVFIACFPPIYKGKDGTPAKDLDRQRGYDEIVKPVKEGCMNVLEAAARKNVKTVILCSSTSSTNPPEPVAVKTEENAVSDAEVQMNAGKFTAAEKIVMETAAKDFCDAHGMRLSIIIPTMMLGPVILPQHLEGDSHHLIVGLNKGEQVLHKETPAGSMSLSHIEDVAALFLAAYEKPDASGRYFAVYDSWPWRDLYAEFAKHAPASAMPQPLEGEPEEPTRFDFTRRDSLGVTMRDIPTTIAQMFDWLKTEPFSTRH
ncbi:NAD-dependent epimerase/dehydratase family protein [Cohaesibacter marisflavi]|uniref:NAD-dependent epimerase/dehydratase family protein n=1 Tax=Cohaesibacter marisflavi TaxID=655353 RepID=UPI0029C736A7|nr:NAD-dependent epimerase/dehydratase family protein [Cohaesibacter marisflavi]